MAISTDPLAASTVAEGNALSDGALHHSALPDLPTSLLAAAKSDVGNDVSGAKCWCEGQKIADNFSNAETAGKIHALLNGWAGWLLSGVDMRANRVIKAIQSCISYEFQNFLRIRWQQRTKELGVMTLVAFAHDKWGMQVMVRSLTASDDSSLICFSDFVARSHVRISQGVRPLAEAPSSSSDCSSS